MDEAHVEHAVGFVQHQNLHLGQVKETLLRQVEQTAWGGNQNVHAFFELADLRVHADTAEHHARVDAWQVFAVNLYRFFHLGSEFAGGGQHQGADGFAAKAVVACGALRQLVQHGQGERGCFACAGLGTGEKVLPRYHGWNGLGLDGGGGFVALLAHGLHNGRGQVQFVKVHVSCARPRRGEHCLASVPVGHWSVWVNAVGVSGVPVSLMVATRCAPRRGAGFRADCGAQRLHCRMLG